MSEGVLQQTWICVAGSRQHVFHHAVTRGCVPVCAPLCISV